MHIVMVTVFPTKPDHIDGGVAGVAKYLVDELVKQPNVKLTIVVPKGTTGETTCEQWENFDVFRLGKRWPWLFLPGTVYDIFAGKRQIKSLLRRINPDIVHFQNDAFLAANCSYPHVLTIHGIAECDAMWDSRWGLLRWVKWLLLKLTEEYGRHHVPQVILISKYVKKFLSEKNNIHKRDPALREPKTWLIDNPIADSYFDVDWQFEPGRIFCCCRIRPLKNILGVIKAFAIIVHRFPNAQLRIAGAAEAAYLKACEKEIMTNNLHSSVSYLGNLNIKNVQFELSKSNCLVIPSFQENAPLSIAEAMAVGVPVVGAKVGGIPEMVEDGKIGFLIDPYDIKNIADAVCRILSDENLACSMSRRSKEIARRRFMASSVCKQTMQVYNEILSQCH